MLKSFIAFKIIDVYRRYTSELSDKTVSQLTRNMLFYTSFMLVTTLWCTLLIIYRIWSITRRSMQAEGNNRIYHHIIEALVESSVLYSISLILSIASYAIDNGMAYYSDPIATIARVCISHFSFKLTCTKIN